MPYLMPTGFSTLVFATINFLKKLSEFLKKLATILIPVNKSVEALPASKKVLER